MMRGEELIAASLAVSADRVYTVPGYPVTGLGKVSGAEFVVNEKTALEYALGDSLSGRRAAVIVKNAGMNALADPLVMATTQGLLGGVLVIAGDDTVAKGSQNTQDSRPYAAVAGVPLVEPGAESLHSAVEESFSYSEKFSRVALLRVTEDVLEGEAEGVPAARNEGSGRLAPAGLTMKGRAQLADNVLLDMREKMKTAGIPAEYSPSYTLHPETMEERGHARTLCRECPYRPLFSAIAASGREAICDTGCSLLGKNPPYGFCKANYGLGSSVAVAAASTGLAVTGDYAILHSGINSLIDVYEKGLPLLCIVLVNEKAAMTGEMPVPDVSKYLGWASPEVVSCGDLTPEKIADELRIERSGLKILLVYGQCPGGEGYEEIKL